MRLAGTAGTRGSGAYGRLPACGRRWATVSSWITSPVPSREGPPYCRMPGGPQGRHPGASHSPPRSAAACQGRAVALRVRSAWNMGRRHAPGAEAWAGASAAAAGRATKGTLTPRRARAVRGSRPGPPGARPRGPARRGGGAVLLAWTGPPSLSGPPGVGPPGVSPLRASPSRTLGTRPSSALGPDNDRPPKHPALDLLADRGGSVEEGPVSSRGGDADPFSPPPSA